MRTRSWLVVAAALVLAATLVATGGFSSTDADRTAAISVAGDGDAYLAVDDGPVTVSGNTSDVALLGVDNQAGERLTLDVTVLDDGGPSAPSVENVSVNDSLAPGGSGAVDGDVVCSSGGGGSATVELRLAATGDTVDVTLTRSVDVTCE